MPQSRNQITCTNVTDDNGFPAGGTVEGPGLHVIFQNGPLGRPPGPPNGAFVEDLIVAAIERIRFYQVAANGKFACRQNSLAITKLEEAILWLDDRRAEREQRGVQGLNQP